MGFQTNVRTLCPWKNMVRWKQRNLDKCPWCRNDKEDKTHIIRCKNDDATKKWNENLQTLKNWMTQENSDPQLILSLTQGLQAWQEEEESLKGSLAENAQAKLGWNLVLDGWLCLKWRAQQEAYWAQWLSCTYRRFNRQILTVDKYRRWIIQPVVVCPPIILFRFSSVLCMKLHASVPGTIKRQRHKKRNPNCYYYF